MAELTFNQALIVAAIPTLLSMSSAYFSHKVESNESIIQARLTERDLINAEAIEITKSGTVTYAFPVPIGDNRAWENYYSCRTLSRSRLECAEAQRSIIPSLTPLVVTERVDFGHDV